MRGVDPAGRARLLAENPGAAPAVMDGCVGTDAANSVPPDSPRAMPTPIPTPRDGGIAVAECSEALIHTETEVVTGGSGGCTRIVTHYYWYAVFHGSIPFPGPCRSSVCGYRSVRLGSLAPDAGTRDGSAQLAERCEDRPVRTTADGSHTIFCGTQTSVMEECALGHGPSGYEANYFQRAYLRFD